MDYGGKHNPHSNPKPGPSNQKRVKFVFAPTNQDSSDTLSSSSSCSDEFFQVHPQIPSKFRSHDKPPHPAKSTRPFYENDEINLSNEGSPGSASPFSDITHESLVPIHFLPTQSPPTQVMQRPIGFDPDRIPPSVFSKSSTPTEWSVASNDSLFSIRIGETSFSRELVCRVNTEVTEQEELLQNLKKSGESTVLGSNSSDSKGIEPYLEIEKTIDDDVKIEEVLVMGKLKKNGPKCLVNNEVDMVQRDSKVCDPHQFLEKSQVGVEIFVKPIASRKTKSSSCGMCYCRGFHHDKCFSCSLKWCFSCFKCPSCRPKCPIFSSCCCNCSSQSCFNCSSSSCFKCSSLPCCKCFSWSCFKCSSWHCCKCSSWSCFKCSSWPCCKCSSLSCSKCSSWSCCNCSYWSCFKCSSLSCCKCSSWSCFKCSSLSCCKCSYWSCFKCSSLSCCNCSSWSCFKCSSWSCCNCSSWFCCKCRCLNCTWACCYCRKRQRKTSSCDSPDISSDTTSKSSTKTPSRSKCSCFSCSCCWCWSCSCCC